MTSQVHGRQEGKGGVHVAPIVAEHHPETRRGESQVSDRRDNPPPARRDLIPLAVDTKGNIRLRLSRVDFSFPPVRDRSELALSSSEPYNRERSTKAVLAFSTSGEKESFNSGVEKSGRPDEGGTWQTATVRSRLNGQPKRKRP